MTGLPRFAKFFLFSSAVLFPPLLLSGCAAVPPKSDPIAYQIYQQNDDPLEPFNKASYTVSMTLDKAVMRPVAQAYVDYIPEVIRTALHNFFDNMNEPFVMLSDMLEGKPHLAGIALTRFAVDSTAGVGGLVNVASKLGYKPHQNSLSLAFEYWGIPPGPYVYIPLIGPSSLTGTVAYAMTSVASPWTFAPSGSAYLAGNLTYTTFNLLDTRAQYLGIISSVENTSLSPYAAFRSLYRQSQASQLALLKAYHVRTLPDWYHRTLPSSAKLQTNTLDLNLKRRRKR